MTDTRKNHQASQGYQDACALFEALLGDGQVVCEQELLAAFDARGVSREKGWLAIERLNVIMFCRDGNHQQLFYRLPTVRRPKGITARAWAIDFLRMALAGGEVDEHTLIDWVHEYDVGIHAFYQAKRELGVLHRVEQVPHTTLEDGSTMYRCDEYWRLPGQPMLCTRCHQQPRLFDSSWCADCQQLADDRWEQFKATHPNVVE